MFNVLDDIEHRVNDLGNHYNLRQTAERRARNVNRDNADRQQDDDGNIRNENPHPTAPEAEPDRERDSDSEGTSYSAPLDETDVEEESFHGFPDLNRNRNRNRNRHHRTRYTMATSMPVLTRFVGRIQDRNDPDKDRLESYNVYQFLADLDSRITSQGIYSDIDKIKEAQLLVHAERGDAKNIMLSPIFTEITTYDGFKAKCIEIWEPGQYKDRFFNMQQLRNPKMVGNEYMLFVDGRKAVDRVLNDVLQNSNITKYPGGPRNQLFDGRELLSYLSYGGLFDAVPEDFQAAFKKVTLNPKEDHLTILKNIKNKMTEAKVRVDSEVVAVAQYKSNRGRNTNVPPSRGGTNTVAQGARGKQPAQQNKTQVPPRMNQRGGYGQGQGGNYQNNSYRNYRGRGGYNYHNRGRIECKKCGRTNHRTNECIYCDYCNKSGHYAKDCYHKQRDRGQRQEQQQQGQGQSN